MTNTSQTMVNDSAYAPFGEQYASTGIGFGGFYDFTGQQQWTSPGLDDFLYRRYHPVQGRWISADPAGSSAVDLTNPQTWNRYAYVGNNPLNATDPLGLYCAIQMQYAHYDVGCGNTGLAWGAGIFTVGYQWVPGSSTGPDPIPGSDPNDPNSPSFTMNNTIGGWQVVGLGLPGGSWGWTSSAIQSVSNWFKKTKTTITNGRQPSESFTHCVGRMQNTVLGNTGQTILNSVVPISALSGAATQPLGTITVGQRTGYNVYTMTKIPAQSAAEIATGEAVGAGFLDSSVLPMVSAAAPVVSKASIWVFATGAAIDAGFAAACF